MHASVWQHIIWDYLQNKLVNPSFRQPQRAMVLNLVSTPKEFTAQNNCQLNLNTWKTKDLIEALLYFGNTNPTLLCCSEMHKPAVQGCKNWASLMKCLLYFLEHLWNACVLVGRIQPFWVRKPFRFQEIDVEYLTLIPCTKVTKDSHNRVARTHFFS